MHSFRPHVSLLLQPWSARLFGAMLIAVIAFAAASARPAHAQPRAGDHAAIAQVLETYRRAVSTGDEALFSTTLLDDQIPFFAVVDGHAQAASLQSQQLRGVAQFRQNVFHSGRRYTQQFDEIRIAQDGALAQATLRFITRRGDGTGGAGWKTLTLVQVGGDWKIASEFYTVRAVQDAAPPTP